MIINCGCAKTGKRFEAVFENGNVETRKPAPVSFLGKLARRVTVPVAGLGIGNIRCLYCSSKVYLCHCGLVCCRGGQEGDLYRCLCGHTGALGPLSKDARVSGGHGVKALGGPAVKMLR